LVGGLAASILGVRAIFWAGGGLLAAATIPVFAIVQEAPPGQSQAGRRPALAVLREAAPGAAATLAGLLRWPAPLPLSHHTLPARGGPAPPRAPARRRRGGSRHRLRSRRPEQRPGVRHVRQGGPPFRLPRCGGAGGPPAGGIAAHLRIRTERAHHRPRSCADG